MKAAIFDLEMTSLKANFGVIICGVVKPCGGEAKIFRVKQVSTDDRRIVADLVEELNKYTVLVAHNGVRFDRPFLNSRAVKWGLPVLNPTGKLYDPVLVARRKLAISWNGLESLACFLGCKNRKYETVGDLWLRASLDHDKVALDEIVKHCIADVALLDEVAERLEPLIGMINSWGSP